MILERGEGQGWGRETRARCPTSMHSLECALTRAWTPHLGVLGQHPNQWSYQARANCFFNNDHQPLAQNGAPVFAKRACSPGGGWARRASDVFPDVRAQDTLSASGTLAPGAGVARAESKEREEQKKYLKEFQAKSKISGFFHPFCIV